MTHDGRVRHEITFRGAGIILLLATLLASFMLWPLLGGQLWIIDDHEIVLFSHLLKSHGGLSLDSFATALGHTELLGFDNGRYRPVYYTLRILKSAWFGGNAALWFSFNAAFLTLSFVIVGACLRRYFGWFWVVTGMISLAALPFHAGLWGRLGPSEIDSFLWCALALLGALWHSNKCRWAWPLFCVATALAIGSKENFILLLIPAGWLLWRDWRQGLLRLPQCVWLLLPVLIAIPVGIVLLKSIFVTGADVYGSSTGKGAALSFVLFFIASGGAYFGYGLLSVLLVARWRQIGNQEALYHGVKALIVIFIMALGNYVFYRGDVAGLNRYGFPYDALFLLAFFVALYPLQISLSRFFCVQNGGGYFVRFSIAIACVVVIFSILIGLSLNTMRIATQIQNTKIFADFRQIAQGYRALGIMTTESAAGWAVEPLRSLQRYHNAGYIPDVFYWQAPTLERAVQQDKTPQALMSDMLLVEFGSPNKRHYLGTFWNRFAYFTHPWSNPHWFRIIEHTRAVRPMAAVLADRPFLPLTAQGEAIFRDGATLYVPADHPQPGTLLLQTSTQLPQDHCWQFTVNGQKVDAHLVPQGLEITITAEMWSMALYHPQILDLELQCSTSAGQTRADLSLLALILNGSES